MGVLQARTEAQRSEELARQGFVAPAKLESDRHALLAVQKEQEAALAERRVATHEVQQALAALGAVQRSGSAGPAFTLRSPVAGRVLRVVQTSEASVALGAPLVKLGDVSRMEVVAELLTTEALRLQVGSPVRIDRWGGDGELQGRVRLVEPAAFTKVSALGVEEQRVKVLIDITSPQDHWRALGDGYRVGVRIVVLAVGQAVQVPLAAVFPRTDEAGGMAVFVVDGQRARLQPVELGARNGSHAWVRHGLAPGAQVVVYPPAATGDGARVKVRKV